MTLKVMQIFLKCQKFYCFIFYFSKNLQQTFTLECILDFRWSLQGKCIKGLQDKLIALNWRLLYKKRDTSMSKVIKCETNFMIYFDHVTNYHLNTNAYQKTKNGPLILFLYLLFLYIIDNKIMRFMAISEIFNYHIIIILLFVVLFYLHPTATKFVKR